MHAAQRHFVGTVKEFLPAFFTGTRVLEIGSLDINGSIRDLFKGCDHTGLDLGPGKGVDLVCPGQDYAAPGQSFDVVVSCEAMEHDPYWRDTLANALRLLNPRGMFILSCASHGRLRHGTTDRTPADSPFTNSYYRNLEADEIVGAIDLPRSLRRWFFVVNRAACDLYMVGVGQRADDATVDRLAQLEDRLRFDLRQINQFGRHDHSPAITMRDGNPGAVRRATRPPEQLARAIPELVAFAIFHATPFDDSRLVDRLVDLTCHSLHLCFGVAPATLLHGTRVEDILARADKDYVLVQNPGHVFDPERSQAVAPLLRQHMELGVPVVGHILDGAARYGDGQRAFFIHQQCFLIDRRLWEEIGRPAFGHIDPAITARVWLGRRSPENFHDDYTPPHVLPLDLTPSLIKGPREHGWALASAALCAGYPLENWSEGMRALTFNACIDPSASADFRRVMEDARHHHAVEHPNVRRMALYVCRKDAATAPFISPVNTESDFDLPDAPVGERIDRAVLASKGLKSVRLLARHRFDERTRVCVFDINPCQLAFRRLMVEEWDGRGFEGFVRWAAGRIRTDLDGSTPVIHQEADMGRLFHRQVIDFFGSESAWLDVWEQYRRCPHEYVLCDVTEDPSPLVARSQTCLLWYSNIFDYWSYAFTIASWRREEAHRRMLGALRDQCASLHAYGVMPLRFDDYSIKIRAPGEMALTTHPHRSTSQPAPGLARIEKNTVFLHPGDAPATTAITFERVPLTGNHLFLAEASVRHHRASPVRFTLEITVPGHAPVMHDIVVHPGERLTWSVPLQAVGLATIRLGTAMALSGSKSSYAWASLVDPRIFPDIPNL